MEPCDDLLRDSIRIVIHAKENEYNPEYFVQTEEEVDILSPTLIGVDTDTVILQ